MNVDRAEKIVQTSERIQVKLDGVPVWIDSVDSATGKATVHNEDNPARVKVVNVDDLQEA
ncbi:spore protein [Gordoniibacillus kamchatkensis]|uniref:Spore protein n=1 Tax=Gordoniibacillus kamchatkensis TaxID=1590651 RepID=A0ABR5A9N8_9BACL|nr:H-type small acid-soluble spore protein [Paenibacillus sp. VKM B-2647]KIL37781.1 spore protein [Paenibacillus sp. VKM B-2647]